MQSNHAAIPHMEHIEGEWRKTSPNEHLTVTLSATLCLEGYCAMKTAAPNQSATGWDTTQTPTNKTGTSASTNANKCGPKGKSWNHHTRKEPQASVTRTGIKK